MRESFVPLCSCQSDPHYLALCVFSLLISQIAFVFASRFFLRYPSFAPGLSPSCHPQVFHPFIASSGSPCSGLRRLIAEAKYPHRGRVQHEWPSGRSRWVDSLYKFRMALSAPLVVPLMLIPTLLLALPFKLLVTGNRVKPLSFPFLPPTLLPCYMPAPLLYPSSLLISLH